MSGHRSPKMMSLMAVLLAAAALIVVAAGMAEDERIQEYHKR